MNDHVIEIRNLGKKYLIGKNRAGNGMLRDAIAGVFRRPFGKRGNKGSEDETVWALSDVSLNVKRGEIFGIIGRNGAGKSTLLKIISRITEPTAGSVDIRGRVGSLLEVGTGFHPELTGRENVYLNGAILGMRKEEVKRKFDEIVTFSEVEKFIDTPVKHYSSGMYLRLAFSVAVHLEPTILLVDEVLAVGDIAFWTKSINRMRALNEQGMTLLLVSHDMWLVQTLCSRVVCLEKGRVVAEGEPVKVIGAYKNRAAVQFSQRKNGDNANKGESGEICSFQVLPEGRWSADKEAFSDSGIRMNLLAKVTASPKVKFLFRVTAPDGFPYFTVYSDLVDNQSEGPIECEAVIPHLMLMPGEYVLWGSVCSDAAEEHIIAEKSIPLFVKSDGSPRHEKSFFWNRADWSIRVKDDGETG